MSNGNAIKAGRYTAKYWEGKVFRPVFTDRHGEQKECSTYYVRIAHAGTRKAVPLQTSDRAEAGRQASKFFGRLRAVGWDLALKEHDPQQIVRKCAVTLGDVIGVLNGAAMNKRTRSNYISALRWFGARQIGFHAEKKTFGPKGSASYREKVESVRLTDLSDSTVQTIIDNLEEAAGEDEDARRSARISAASFLRNAKAALTLAAGKGVKLPEPAPFRQVKSPRNIQPPRYVSTINAGELLRAAKEELKGEPGAFIAILLALGAGLRRSEILNLRWRGVDRGRNRVLIVNTETFTAKTEDSEASVQVDPGLISELEQFRAGIDDPVATPTAMDEAVSWLRKKGIDGFMPLHTLRKESGSLVCEGADLLAASRHLRHSSLATTASVYVENRKDAAPKIGAMLRPPAEQNAKTNKIPDAPRKPLGRAGRRRG